MTNLLQTLFSSKNKGVTTTSVPATSCNFTNLFVPYKKPLPLSVGQYIAGHIRFHDVFVPYCEPYVPLELRRTSKKSEDAQKSEDQVAALERRIPKHLVPFPRILIHWITPTDLFTSVLWVLKEYCGGKRDGKEDLIHAMSKLHMTCHSFSGINLRLLSRAHRKHEKRKCKKNRHGHKFIHD